MESINRKAVSGRLLLSIIALMIFISCSATHTGGIRISREVTQQFENLQIDPDYRYWYLNQENNPFGVAGLDREFELDAGSWWVAVDPKSATFKKVVGLVRDFPVPGSYTSGALITDNGGRPIGGWYSSLGAGIRVDPATKVVSISTEMPWVFRDNF